MKSQNSKPLKKNGDFSIEIKPSSSPPKCCGVISVINRRKQSYSPTLWQKLGMSLQFYVRVHELVCFGCVLSYEEKKKTKFKPVWRRI